MVAVKKNSAFFFTKVSKHCMCYVESISALSLYERNVYMFIFSKLSGLTKRIISPNLYLINQGVHDDRVIAINHVKHGRKPLTVSSL